MIICFPNSGRSGTHVIVIDKYDFFLIQGHNLRETITYYSVLITCLQDKQNRAENRINRMFFEFRETNSIIINNDHLFSDSGTQCEENH